MALITDIFEGIKAGLPDKDLNPIIQSYLDEYEPLYSVSTWRIENYTQLRRWAYPSVTEYVDANVKISKGGSLSMEGKSQLREYTDTCYAVKLRFPKS